MTVVIPPIQLASNLPGRLVAKYDTLIPLLSGLKVMKIACKACGRNLQLSETHLGKTVRCPQCQATMKVRGNGSPSESARPSSQETHTKGARRIQCPKCHRTLSLPSRLIGSVVACPSCRQTLRLKKKPQRASASQPIAAPSQPTAPLSKATATTSKPAAFSSNGDLNGAFDDLPPITLGTGGTHLGSTAGFSADSPNVALSSPSAVGLLGTGNKTSSYPARVSAIGPGILLCVESVIGFLLSAGFGVLVLLGSASGNPFPQGGAWAVGVLVVFSVLYHLALLFGSITMMLGRNLYVGRATCILALLPLSLSYLLSLMLLYPLALAGGIWGLVALFSNPHKPRVPAVGQLGGLPPASLHPSPAPNASPTDDSSDQPISSQKAVLCILGGLVAFAIAGGVAYLLLTHGDEIRKPMRATAACIGLVITGFSLIGTGIAGLSNNS